MTMLDLWLSALMPEGIRGMVSKVQPHFESDYICWGTLIYELTG